ncbi:MAG: DUF5331 domain-containing protein [Halothece sp.]
MDLVDELENLKATLKDKWLDYYEANYDWLEKLRLHNTYDLEDGNTRPSTELILGVITSIEPKLKKFMPFLTILTSDEDKILEALGLNFEPDNALKERENERAKSSESLSDNTDPDTDYLNKIRKEITHN